MWELYALWTWMLLIRRRQSRLEADVQRQQDPSWGNRFRCKVEQPLITVFHHAGEPGLRVVAARLIEHLRPVGHALEGIRHVGTLARLIHVRCQTPR